MKCKVISKVQSKEYQDIHKLILPTYNGSVCVLPHHAEAFFLLQKGQCFLHRGEEIEKVEIEDGVCHVRKEEIIIFS